MRNFWTCRRVLALPLLWGLPLLAWADQPLWELGLGAGAVSLPHYRGSDQSHNWVLPVPYVIYRGEFFQADREGTRAVLLNRRNLDLDISLDVSAPVKSSDNLARTGMPDLPATLEIGPNVNLTLARSPDWKLDLRVPIRAGFTLNRAFVHTGLVVSPRLNLDARVKGWNLGLQAGPSWGDRQRHAFFYDVDTNQSTVNRPSYRAEGGFAGWEGTVALSRKSGQMWTGIFVRADSTAGARYQDSPLVRSRSNWSAGVAMAWVLKTSSTFVPDRN